MTRYGVLIAGLALAAPAPAKAAWSAEERQGYRSARVESDGGALGVGCAVAANGAAATITVTLQGSYPTGLVTFVVDGGAPVIAEFRSGALKADTPPLKAQHRQVVAALQRGAAVEVLAGGGVRALFSLDGARRAIGPCRRHLLQPAIAGD